MKENDFDFIKQVTEFYYSTVDGENKKGNISKVMEKFSISRTKALKILITSGAIDTPLHRDIMKLKEEGYDAEEIARVNPFFEEGVFFFAEHVKLEAELKPCILVLKGRKGCLSVAAQYHNPACRLYFVLRPLFVFQ